MSKWWVEFNGCCVVEGNNHDEAECNFALNITHDGQKAIPYEVYNIEGITLCEKENESNV